MTGDVIAGNHFGCMIRVEDQNLAIIGIDQPPQLSAVGDPIVHLIFEVLKRIGLRTEFNHKVRAYLGKTPQRASWEAAQVLLRNVGSVRAQRRSISKPEAGAGIENTPQAFGNAPVPQLSRYFLISAAGPSTSGRVHANGPFLGAFQPNIAIFPAQRLELRIRNGRVQDQDSWQRLSVDPKERAHWLILPPFGFSVKLWGNVKRWVSREKYFASTPDGVTTVDCIGSLLRLSLKHPGLAREILG
jgi:hypothetical protein